MVLADRDGGVRGRCAGITRPDSSLSRRWTGDMKRSGGCMAVCWPACTGVPGPTGPGTPAPNSDVDRVQEIVKLAAQHALPERRELEPGEVEPVAVRIGGVAHRDSEVDQLDTAGTLVAGGRLAPTALLLGLAQQVVVHGLSSLSAAGSAPRRTKSMFSSGPGQILGRLLARTGRAADVCAFSGVRLGGAFRACRCPRTPGVNYLEGELTHDEFCA